MTTESQTQSELIRALQEELADKERELALQRRAFEQVLQSRSWRLTCRLRWVAKQLRTIKDAVSGLLGKSQPVDSGAMIEAAPISPAAAMPVSDPKKLFTSLSRTSFESFLVSEAVLELPSSPDPEVSIILVLFNRSELTFACLRSIAETYSEKIEVIIVDNASSDETRLLLDRLRGARIIRNRENRNFLLAVNQAAEHARGQYLLLLNNDAQLLPGSLRAALATLRGRPDIGAVGGKIILLDGTLQEAGSIVWRDGSCLGYGRGDTPFAPSYMFRRDVDYCSGAFLLTPRSLWEQLGGFDESFAPAYYEETDYCMRLWQRGYRVVYEPGAAVLHYEFASSQSVTGATGLQSAHQLVFAARHRSALDKREPPGIGRAIHARMRHNGRRVLFLDDQPPHPWLGSGYPRAHAMLRAFLKHGCFVTLYPLFLFDEEWSKVYSDIPRDVEVMIGAGPDKLKPFLRNRGGYYDFIIVSRPHNMERFQPILVAHPEWFDKTRVVYDAEALFAHRQAGRRKVSGNPMSPRELEGALRAEIRLAAGADCVVAVSEQDGAAFKRHGIKNVCIIGHSVAPAPTSSAFEERTGFLFVGAVHEEESPNADSLVWFLTEVFARIQEKLGAAAPLTIAGVNRSQKIRELAGPSVRITGPLADLTSLYAGARVFIAPTRYAAGIPHKVHEAAARGLPVVATPLLAEQLEWTDRELAIGDTAGDFAARCVEVYSDPVKWARLRDAALHRITIECSQDTFERRVYDILARENADDQSSAARFANAGMDG